MKLVFSKNEQLEISVMQKTEDDSDEFSYVDMIKNLIDTKSLEEPETHGDFTEVEKDSILSMIKHINSEVSDFYSEDEDGDE